MEECFSTFNNMFLNLQPEFLSKLTDIFGEEIKIEQQGFVLEIKKNGNVL